MVVSGGFTLYYLILGLLRIGVSFVMLGPEGIVYKLPRCSIQGFTWGGIYMDFFKSQSAITELNIMKIGE